MRYRHPTAEITPNGAYTGVGMRNAPTTWAPFDQRTKPAHGSAPTKQVAGPRRTTRSVMAPTPIYIRICMCFLVLPVLIPLIQLIWSWF